MAALQPGGQLRITDATSSKVSLCDDAGKLWALFGTLLATSGCAHSCTHLRFCLPILLAATGT